MGEAKRTRASEAEIDAVMKKMADMWEVIAPPDCNMLLVVARAGGGLFMISDGEAGVPEAIARGAVDVLSADIGRMPDYTGGTSGG